MHVTNPPDNPTLLFDGTCGFCRKWVARLAESADNVDTRPYQEALPEFKEIPETACEQSVQWIETDGAVVNGADAALRFWASSSWAGKLAHWKYRTIPGNATISEFLYRVVARARPITSILAQLCWGEQMLRPTFRVTGDLFLRVLGLIYLVAFLSLFVQAEGLIGSQGILPANQTLQIVGERFGLSGYFEFPSLLWLWSSDTALLTLCAAGAITGAIGIAAPYLWFPWIASWTLYLSFVSIGRNFLSFQWDALLLETGFLAILHVLLHTHGWAAGSDRRITAFSASPTPMRAVGWAYRWLLFRLMFSSGVVKLTSGDTSWWSLTALTRHYETQPLPNIVAWYAHHLSPDFHAVSCVVMFAIELIAPFLFFAPRRLRNVGAISTIGLQCLITLTGNYTYFNILTIALCFWLIEDLTWPDRIRERFRTPLVRRRPNALRHLVAPAIGLNLMLSALLLTRGAFRSEVRFPDLLHQVHQTIAPYRVINTYGLFSVMTMDRPEIVLEGSSDGVYWEPYEFYYKPGDIRRSPPFVAPHQPRLDWQMWFAALGPIRNSPWFYYFTQRLLEGSAPVKRLLALDPFPDSPPRYLRAHIYDYRFATPEERTLDRVWWKRSLSHAYLPTISRRTQ
jgi:lipase maturation factor 1